MSTRAALLALSLLLAMSGCSNVAEHDAADSGPQAESSTGPASPVGPHPAQRGGLVASHGSGFASLPDHGDLVAYPGRVVRQEGAYTWYRTNISEAHALRAMAGDRLRVTTPDGEILDFKYDRHIEHPSGDWTWVGHLPGHEGARAILTFGAQAVFGSIAQQGKRSLRLSMRDGLSWLVETDSEKLAAMGGAAARSLRPDYRIVPDAALRHAGGPMTRMGAAPAASAMAALAATAASPHTVDLLLGYTQGFASAHGGSSGALTRLNYLVDVANTAYIDSQINAQVRLVKAMQVNYIDNSSNDTALEEMTGYDADAQQEVTPNPAFDALRAAREEYGADLVSLVRDFRTPENEGCGIAWLLGGSLGGTSAIQASADFGYLVVSDGVDSDEGDGKNYFCLDESLAHELGHSMGAAHDKDTAKGDDGTLDNPDDYGAFTYSFGYKTTASTGNFYTIMAYGDSGQKIWGSFSNPNTTFCGGNACGTGSEDNARTLNQTMPAVAGFRNPVFNTRSAVVADFNGDGISDVLWLNLFTGVNTIWKAANKSSQQAVARIRDLAWREAGIGDFDGDGKSDILWHNAATGGSIIWRSGNSVTLQYVASVSGGDWGVAGIGDFNGDGRSDIFWRNSSTGSNAIWFSARRDTYFVMTPVVNPGWFAAGVGDVDGDGVSDVLWRNAVTGGNIIWRSARSQTTMSMSPVTNFAWQVAAIADFDGNGRDDIFWRDGSTGGNTIWKGSDASNRQIVASVTDTLWEVAASSDYNGDGKADVLWRNSATGSNAIWQSAVNANQQPIANVTNPGWVIGN